jgi:glycosyltransferase involved in cell wall biosynthesis
MRLLQVVGTLDPAFGGPPVVLNQITRSLLKLGHEVEVLTLDAPSSPWLADCPGTVRAAGPGCGTYRYIPRLVPLLRLQATSYDALIVHGIWQYQSRAVREACRRTGVPYFIFVHGALDPWFKRRYPAKHLKKALYWRLSEVHVLRDARAVLYTCEEEQLLARQSFRPYRATEAIVRLGTEEPPGSPILQREAFLDAHPQLRGMRNLLFLSRLHPKKGCDLLIQAFARACPRDDRLRLVIAGPDDAGCRLQLMALAESLGVTDRIAWTGMLTGDVKWGAYRTADVFALTSHSENFGVVVAEALACGLPVLISDKVNIWREIDRCGAGFVDADTVTGARALLDRWLNLSEPEKDLMRRRARACFLQRFEMHGATIGFAGLISRAIDKGGRR